MINHDKRSRPAISTIRFHLVFLTAPVSPQLTKRQAKGWPIEIRLRRLGRAKEEDGIFIKNFSFLLLR